MLKTNITKPFPNFSYVLVSVILSQFYCNLASEEGFMDWILDNLNTFTLMSYGNAPSAHDGEKLFSPILTATCKTRIMTIKLETWFNFNGIIHSR